MFSMSIQNIKAQKNNGYTYTPLGLAETCDPDKVYNELYNKYVECTKLTDETARNNYVQNPRSQSVRALYNNYFTTLSCKD